MRNNEIGGQKGKFFDNNAVQYRRLFSTLLVGLFVLSTIIVIGQRNAFASGNVIEDIRLKKVTSFAHFDTPVFLCGENDDYDLSILLKNYHFILYDDDSYRITSTTYVKFFNSAGLLVASSPQTQLSSTSTNQFNVIIHCANSEKQDLNYHLGFSIDKAGEIKAFHLVYS